MLRRCFSWFAAGSVALVMLASASAQPRIPADAANGRLTIVQWPVISIDGHELRAAPGARIITSGNLTVTPNAVPPDTRVQYLINGAGQVQTIWLTAPGSDPSDAKK